MAQKEIAEKVSSLFSEVEISVLAGDPKAGVNPAVGAIIVKDGKIVGRGHTSELGGPHAEINALRDAGPQAKDATVYVTLEPCAHWGRTGPCCETLTKAQVKRVVIGIRDPFPLVDGKGIEHLKQHGVEVEVGFLEQEIKEDLKEFLERVEKQRIKNTNC